MTDFSGALTFFMLIVCFVTQEQIQVVFQTESETEEFVWLKVSGLQYNDRAVRNACEMDR